MDRGKVYDPTADNLEALQMRGRVVLEGDEDGGWTLKMGPYGEIVLRSRNVARLLARAVKGVR